MRVAFHAKADSALVVIDGDEADVPDEVIQRWFLTAKLWEETQREMLAYKRRNNFQPYLYDSESGEAHANPPSVRPISSPRRA